MSKTILYLLGFAAFYAGCVSATAWILLRVGIIEPGRNPVATILIGGGWGAITTAFGLRAARRERRNLEDRYGKGE